MELLVVLIGQVQIVSVHDKEVIVLITCDKLIAENNVKVTTGQETIYVALSQYRSIGRNSCQF